MKKIVISFIGFIVFIGSVLLINYNTPNIDLKIYATKDSFANNYANKYHLEFEEVAESEKNNYFISLENFEYKQVDGGIELNKYLGFSLINFSSILSFKKVSTLLGLFFSIYFKNES